MSCWNQGCFYHRTAQPWILRKCWHSLLTVWYTLYRIPQALHSKPHLSGFYIIKKKLWISSSISVKGRRAAGSRLTDKIKKCQQKKGRETQNHIKAIVSCQFEWDHLMEEQRHLGPVKTFQAHNADTWS